MKHAQMLQHNCPSWDNKVELEKMAVFPLHLCVKAQKVQVVTNSIKTIKDTY